MVDIAEIIESAEEIAPGVIADRRYLHQHPELGFQEENTARFVAERLRTFNLDAVQTGVARTGVVGILHGGKGPGRCVLLRADMDALPITELNDVPYKSENVGSMHACGHDAHTAMLLGAARVLAERRGEFAGTVKFVFQPSEEANGGGAQPMIAAGVLENPHVDAAFGIHVGSNVQAGQVAVRPGAVNASADSAQVTIRGLGGHAARPQLAIDPIVVGAHCIVALQTLVSREVDPFSPAVITVGTSMRAPSATSSPRRPPSGRPFARPTSRRANCWPSGSRRSAGAWPRPSARLPRSSTPSGIRRSSTTTRWPRSSARPRWRLSARSA